MPRGFTEDEFSYYKKRLVEVAIELFGQYGLSGVSIDRIIKEVGIAKGSFYKFFRNKEDLCYDAMMLLEKEVREGFVKDMTPYTTDPGQLMKKITLEIVQVMNRYPLLKIFQNRNEMQQLMLKVDPAKHEANFSGDVMFVGKLLQDTGILNKTDIETITGYIWAVVLLSLNSDFFNGQFDQVIGLIGDMAESYFNK